MKHVLGAMKQPWQGTESGFRDALKLIQHWVPSSALLSSLTRFLHLLSDLRPTLGAQQRSCSLTALAVTQQLKGLFAIVVEKLDSLSATQQESC